MVRLQSLVVRRLREMILRRRTGRSLGHRRPVAIRLLILIIPRLQNRFCVGVPARGVELFRLSKAGPGCGGFPVVTPGPWFCWPAGPPRHGCPVETPQLTHRDRVNRRPGDVGDMLRLDAAVDDGPVVAVKIEVVDDRGLIEYPRFVPCLDAKMARMRVAKISGRHKREEIRGQAKIKSNAHAIAAINEAHAGPVNRKRRQWRPAAVIIRVTPCHPGRRPDSVRPPAPAQARIMKPASVVERDAPRIIRGPIPAAIAVNPMPAVAIRLPAGVVNDERSAASIGHSLPRPPRFHTAQVNCKNNSP